MTDPTGFWTRECVEAAAQIAHETWCDDCLACTGPSDDDEAQGEAVLLAALAAKDREAMIETVARTLAEAFDYSDVFEPDYPETAMHGPAYWRWLAGQALTALGLLASPGEKEH